MTGNSRQLPTASIEGNGFRVELHCAHGNGYVYDAGLHHEQFATLAEAIEVAGQHALQQANERRHAVAVRILARDGRLVLRMLKIPG
ncbi:TPA: hypothetical protein UOJ25_001747 [Stenotrophomonas maltophilia]|nr:hypothetical protein [Stenotrophomonas maltophilia]